MRQKGIVIRWGLIWCSPNLLGEERNFIILGDDDCPMLFRTREDARKHREGRYSYIRKSNKMGVVTYQWKWRMPKVVKLEIELCR